MHVCIVVENHPAAVMGGAQYQAHLLAQELSSRAGVDVTYLARRVPEGSTANSLGYASRRIGNARGWRRKAMFMDGPSLRAALEDIRPDAIYQRMKQGYTAACASYARSHRIPFTLHIASDIDLDPSLVRGRWLSANLPLDVIEAACGNRGLKRATRIVTQTQRQASLLKQRFGREAARVIGNFQPLPARLPVKREPPMKVLWVGNFKDVKRPERFLELASRLRPARDIEFVMVGREVAEQAKFQRLEAKIRECGNIRRLGEQPLEEVNRLFEEAHVLVNTSLYEGFSNTFIQAWGNGAVVTTLGVDVDGGLDSQGIGFATPDVEALAILLERLARSPGERAEIARRAFAHVHRAYSMSNARLLGDLVCTPV